MKRIENERKLQRKSKSGRRGELSREELLLISDDIGEIEYTFDELLENRGLRIEEFKRTYD
ncbi:MULTISPECIES: hypothetical protein [Parageobacillus]|uniref:hypothetical protein n=1 Tax=Parageobacillus TaxID=1906945 RepID=UPI000B0E78F2|nr:MULTISPECIES: hypothetical protein [Parageobacillus]BDG45999.1 hypothetical protein PspKH34_05600 [Parageobacillus sp. KH3-4]